MNLRYIVTDKGRTYIHHGRSTDLYTSEKQARRYAVGTSNLVVLEVDLDDLYEVEDGCHV